MVEKKKVPEIRFQGFTGAWEQRKLSEIATMHARIGWQNLRTSEFLENGDYYLITGTDFIDGKINLSNCHYIAKERYEQDKNIQIENGSILITKDGTIGKVAYVSGLNKPATLNAGVFNVVVKRNDIDRKYLYQYLKAPYLMDYVSKRATGGTIKHLNQNILIDFPVDLPSYNEQKKIGAFFLALDKTITLHQRKYEKLVNVKKSMLRQLFVQEESSVPQIRFGNFTSSWQRVRLGDIVVPYSDPVETPHDGYERLGVRSHGKGVFHEYVEAGKELGTAQMHRVASHNLIVNITFAWEHAVAITVDDDEGKLVSHRFPQFSMSEKVYDQFLKYLILDANFRHHLLLASPGGAGRNRVLKVPEMLAYEMVIPSYEEQKQIADFLNSLDDLIELYRLRVDKLKKIKLACLQKMFV
ncbi:restriction endonuclease subunit S [Veillonella magna]|uniref:restriction endonuclease subunit S n=1 Tax=Veillonella magna TaxID=464322 RepID=UPI0023F58C58|nr:restriction endonuclease subunit S [Veillonella magna]